MRSLLHDSAMLAGAFCVGWVLGAVAVIGWASWHLAGELVG